MRHSERRAQRNERSEPMPADAGRSDKEDTAASICALICARPEIADPLGERLRERDWDIHQINSPGQLDDARRQRAPTVLLVDAALPVSESTFQTSKDSDAPICGLIVDSYSPTTLTEAMERGASTVVRWPDDVENLVRSVKQEIRRRRAGHSPAEPSIDVPAIVGRSEAMERIAERVVHTAPSDANVLVTGESGTGKELVARTVHRLSPRRDRPFVAVNCGAIPENLIESELFGHEEGAFTDAQSRRIGRFELADGGTLFLDEVAELADAMQVKLLRVLQEQTFQRVGGSEDISVDVRVVAATNRPLSPHPSGSQPLREDLFFRLNVLRIHAPPLRERPDDIDPLWTHFLDEAARREARPHLDVDEALVERLYDHDWPGNVREVRNVARHAVALASGGRIDVECLPAYLRDEDDDTTSSTLVGRSLEELERAAILQTCDATETVKQAADLLGVSERTIYYRKDRYRDSDDADDNHTA